MSEVGRIRSLVRAELLAQVASVANVTVEILPAIDRSHVSDVAGESAALTPVIA